MPFNSLKYFLFLPIVYLVFYFVSERARWSVLLAASLLFYAALKVPYLLVVLILVAITTYSFGIWIDQADTPKAKRALLWGGIGTNLLILVVMKYLPFLSENLNKFSKMLSLDAQIQPVKAFVYIGVSYYVFQAISYLVDIYLEFEKPERHFGYFALYLAFFPKLLQGPIERAGDLIPQIKTRYEFNYDNIRFGMLLFTWGLFKKVVIADRLVLYVDAVYNDVHAFRGLPLLLATYAYAFQIYMDFSGYTDMALGSARLFNINLTQNFNSPYLATSVIDFWRRWHISFSRWILDYIFKPLQIHWRSWKNFGIAAALIATFLVSGIWHGASWGFVIWGGLHGLYMAWSVFYKPFQKKLHYASGIENTRLLKVWQIFVTFNLVNFAWVFFRANNLGDALYVISNLFYGYKGLSSDFLFSQGKAELTFLLLSCIIYLTIRTSLNSKHIIPNIIKKPFLRWSFYYLWIMYLILFHVTKSQTKFLYLAF
jgi:D-alanyl-lipoteichoic acid acyltransferase DltB (MBOAT superfamily)